MTKNPEENIALAEKLLQSMNSLHGSLGGSNSISQEKKSASRRKVEKNAPYEFDGNGQPKVDPILLRNLPGGNIRKVTTKNDNTR